MKYECENCFTCCITASPSVTYCALASECSQSLISYRQALVFTLLIVVLLAAALAFLYLAFRNRQLASSQSHTQLKEPAFQEPPLEGDSPPQVKPSELQIQSRLSGRRRGKSGPSTRPTSKRSVPTDTERGLR
jgi:hypothetical protein